MTLSNTTSAQDNILSALEDQYEILKTAAQAVEDSIDVINELDDKLSEAKETIKKLEAELAAK